MLFTGIDCTESTAVKNTSLWKFFNGRNFDLSFKCKRLVLLWVFAFSHFNTFLTRFATQTAPGCCLDRIRDCPNTFIIITAYWVPQNDLQSNKCWIFKQGLQMKQERSQMSLAKAEVEANNPFYDSLIVYRVTTKWKFHFTLHASTSV